MKKEKITIGNFSFEYYPCSKKTDKVMILILASSSDTNFIAKPAAKYFQDLDVNMVSFMPVLDGQKYTGWKDFPLEKLEETIDWCLSHGNRKVGLAGASATSIVSLTAASLMEKVSLVIVMAVMDYVMQGSHIGKRENGMKEWPAENMSMLTYHGEQIPYSPYNLTDQEFHNLSWGDFKRGDFNILKMMDWIEEQPEFERGLIPVEKAHAKIVAFGAENDTACYAARNIRRIGERLKKAGYAYGFEPHTYDCCSHYIYPQKLITNLLPIGSSFVLGLMFKAEKERAGECVEARRDVDRIIRKTLREW